jgi:hypothetical protein
MSPQEVLERTRVGGAEVLTVQMGDTYETFVDTSGGFRDPEAKRMKIVEEYDSREVITVLVLVL